MPSGEGWFGRMLWPREPGSLLQIHICTRYIIQRRVRAVGGAKMGRRIPLARGMLCQPGLPRGPPGFRQGRCPCLPSIRIKADGVFLANRNPIAAFRLTWRIDDADVVTTAGCAARCCHHVDSDPLAWRGRVHHQCICELYRLNFASDHQRCAGGGWGIRSCVGRDLAARRRFSSGVAGGDAVVPWGQFLVAYGA